MSSVFKEETKAEEQPHTTPAEQASWWIPHDPITERRLVLVLTKMAKCVLDHAQELPPADGEIPSQNCSAKRMGATHFNN